MFFKFREGIWLHSSLNPVSNKKNNQITGTGDKTMKNFTQKIRTTGICLITATAIALPGTGHAGWFSDAKPVKKVTKTVVQPLKAKAGAKVKSAANQLQARVEDMSSKLDEVYAQLENGRPLKEALENSNMMETVKEVMQYVGDSQQDYQQFANSGVYVFEQEVNDLFYDLTDIIETMQLDAKLKTQINKIRDLIAKMPTQFLYVMKKAVGERITEIRERVQQIKNNLVFVADLPSNRDMFTNPMSHKSSLCPIVQNRDKKVSYAIIMGRLSELELVAGTLNDLSPDDLYASGTAVAGGGTTVGKFPTKLITILIKHIVGSIKVNLENTKSIAEAVCE